MKGVDRAAQRPESRSKKRVRTVEAVERESAHEGTLFDGHTLDQAYRELPVGCPG